MSSIAPTIKHKTKKTMATNPLSRYQAYVRETKKETGIDTYVKLTLHKLGVPVRPDAAYAEMTSAFATHVEGAVVVAKEWVKMLPPVPGLPYDGSDLRHARVLFNMAHRVYRQWIEFSDVRRTAARRAFVEDFDEVLARLRQHRGVRGVLDTSGEVGIRTAVYAVAHELWDKLGDFDERGVFVLKPWVLEDLESGLDLASRKDDNGDNNKEPLPWVGGGMVPVRGHPYDPRGGLADSTVTDGLAEVCAKPYEDAEDAEATATAAAQPDSLEDAADADALARVKEYRRVPSNGVPPRAWKSFVDRYAFNTAKCGPKAPAGQDDIGDVDEDTD